MTDFRAPPTVNATGLEDTMWTTGLLARDAVASALRQADLHRLQDAARGRDRPGTRVRGMRLRSSVGRALIEAGRAIAGPGPDAAAAGRLPLRR